MKLKDIWLYFMAKLFISYTRRDGYVTAEKLQELKNNLEKLGFFNIFIHALEPKQQKHEQYYVIKSLIKSDLIFLIQSPEVYKSKWVWIEIILGKIFLKKIIKINPFNL